MRLIRKFKNSFVYKESLHNLWIYVLIIVSIGNFLDSGHYLYLILLLLLEIKIFFISKRLFFISITLLFIFLSNYFIRNIVVTKEIKNEYEGIIHIIKREEKEDKYRYLVYLENKQKAYLTLPVRFNSGAKLMVEGTLYKGREESYDGFFNQKKYYEYLGISYSIDCKDYQVISTNGFSIYILQDILLNYTQGSFDNISGGFIRALVLGDGTGLDREFKSSLQSIGVSHLLVISGLHVSLFLLFLGFLYKIFKIPSRFQQTISYCFLISYFIITGFLVSVWRVLFTLILHNFKKRYDFAYSGLDLLSFNFILVVLIFPTILFQYRFIFTYIIAFSLLLIQPILKKILKVKSLLYKFILQNITISFASFFIVLPFVTKIGARVNFTSVIYNLVYIPFVSYIFLPCSLLCFCFPFLNSFYSHLCSMFSFVTIFLSKYPFLSLGLSILPVFFFVLYYILYMFIIVSKRKKIKYSMIFTFILFIILWSNKIGFQITPSVTFMDLPLGESTLMIDSLGKNSILIDTGSARSESGVDAILLQKGVKTIDYLILSHADEDHIGNVAFLLKHYDVKNVIYSAIDDKSKSIAKSLSKYVNIIGFKKGSKLQVQNIMIECLYPIQDLEDTNNNSLVLYIDYYNTHFLFTGDIEKPAEEILVSTGFKQKIDVLKIAHHGSTTSSTINFLSYVNPKMAIGMNGYYNPFGFPSNYVCNNLKKAKIRYFMTNRFGSIVFLFKNKGEKPKLLLTREDKISDFFYNPKLCPYDLIK